MASEWVAVAGTAIGAGIGGVVTVVSLWVKGHQDAAIEEQRQSHEDRHRAEDQAWTIRMQNLEERRQLYAKLLNEASQVEISLVVFDMMMTIHRNDPEHEEKSRSEALASRHVVDFRQAMIDAELKSYDRDVIELARAYWETATEARKAIALKESRGLQLVTDLRGLAERLRDACRRDLGFDTPSAAA